MVNIVILTKDRPKLAQQTFGSLLKNTQAGSHSLTAIDDDSTVPHEDGEQIPWRADWAWLRVENSVGITARARNLGVYWSERTFGRGEWLYLSDNDAYFTPMWLEKLTVSMEALEPHGFKLLGGQNHPFHLPIGERQLNSRIKAFEAQALAGTSWLMRWETWDKFGPLQEGAPGVCQGEDGLFCNKIREAGFKVGSLYPHVVLDCGLTQTGGAKSPGWDIKERVAGVYYE